jgi:hypothetical protein
MTSEVQALTDDRLSWEERTAALAILLERLKRALKACGKARAANHLLTAQEIMQADRKRPDYVRGAVGGRFTGIFNADAGVGFGGPWGPTEAEIAAMDAAKGYSTGGVSPAAPPPKPGSDAAPTAGGGPLGDFGPGAPSFGPGAPDFGSGQPSFGSGQPNFGPGVPSFGPGAPTFNPDKPLGPGAPDFGSGAPSFGSGAPDFGSGAPDFNTGGGG